MPIVGANFFGMPAACAWRKDDDVRQSHNLDRSRCLVRRPNGGDARQCLSDEVERTFLERETAAETTELYRWVGEWRSDEARRQPAAGTSSA